MRIIRLKRIYDPPESSDGTRVLVDRLWPRGVSKETAQIAHWMKDVAPSAELRVWFGHRTERFEAFAESYQAELGGDSVQPALDRLRTWADNGGLTLVYAARDQVCNHAVVLKRYLENIL